MIKDSGTRRAFGSGDNAPVRDMGLNKGRFDLIPLDVMAAVMDDGVIGWIAQFEEVPDVSALYGAIEVFCEKAYGGNKNIMMLEVAKHFEEGCNKYGERNWQSGDGIPVWCFIDSALRHYVKWLDGQVDENHDRAVVWNLMCGIWTYTHKVYGISEAEVVIDNLPDHIEELTIPAENFDEIDLDNIDDLLPLE